MGKLAQLELSAGTPSTPPKSRAWAKPAPPLPTQGSDEVDEEATGWDSTR